MAAREWTTIRCPVALGALWLTLGLSACAMDAGAGAGAEKDPPPPPAMTEPPSTPLPTPPPLRNPEQPPPISGGTLLVTLDDQTAVAADPDRDAVWLVDLQRRAVRKRVQLSPASEPGRIAEDADGKIHVVLRGLGQVVKLDPQSGAVESTRAVCPAPRGLTYNAASDTLYVACAGGELVLMKARGGDTAQTWRLENDLRDVVMMGTGATARPVVSRFRSTELLGLDARGVVTDRIRPETLTIVGVDPKNPTYITPAVAWRLGRMPDGRVLMLHQRGSSEPVSIFSGGYGRKGICNRSGIAGSSLTGFAGFAPRSLINGVFASLDLSSTALAVDLAIARDGTKVAFIGPSARSELKGAQVSVLSAGSLAPRSCTDTTPVPIPVAQPVAGAYDGSGQLWIQSRNPALLVSEAGTTIFFPDAEDRANEGHRLFHELTATVVACASCHPEGGDDGRVWTFKDLGKRRTQSLRAGLLATAPFHWDGQLSNLEQLMTQVFTSRMGGPALAPTQVQVLGQWLDAQPALPRSAAQDPQAVARGQALFLDPTVGCASCHSGPRLTDNSTREVGTGQAFQVPSLVGLVSRAPYMHDGCAATLRSRFSPTCGGTDAHGKTSQLAATQLDDLVAYLETL